MKEYLYRYQEAIYGNGVDEFDEPLPGYNIKIQLKKYEIVRRTPKGAWIKMFFDKDKFVLLEAKKKFACETKEDAIESLIKRKSRQFSIVSNQLRRVEQTLIMAQNLKERGLKECIIGL